MSTGDARKLAAIPTVSVVEAAFVRSNNDGTAQVDFGQGQITVDTAGNYSPEPGTLVRCFRINERTVLIGAARPMPKVGEITATGGSVLTIATTAGEEQLPYFIPYTASVTPQVGDLVVVDRSYSRGVVMGKLSTTPAQSYQPPPAPSPSGNFSTDFRATDSGTWYIPGGTWSTNDVWATGTGNNTGAWFYGAQINDTIPDNASIRRVQIYLPEFFNQFPSTPTQIGLHSQINKGGTISVGSTSPVEAGRGWRDLPTSFGDALKAGASWGVGTNGATSGFAKYSGRASDADSGLLRIDWSI